MSRHDPSLSRVQNAWQNASSAPPRASETPRVRLSRAGTVLDLPVYRAFVDGREVGTVAGIEPSPGNRYRATAWHVHVIGGASVREERMADARRWLDAHCAQDADS